MSSSTTTDDSDGVHEIENDDNGIAPETERPLSSSESSTRLKFAASLQSIVDDPEFLKSIEYHTLSPIKRAVNPGITVPGIGSRPPTGNGLIDTLKGLFWTKPPQQALASRYDGDVVPLPLNEATGKDLAGMMRPMVKEEPASWYLEAEDFGLHEFADWREQLEEIKKEACEKLGLQRHQVGDMVNAVPKYLMLHIGEGRGDEHVAWNDAFASKNIGGGTFGVLRFVLPSTRTDGDEEWTLGDDHARETCTEDPQFSLYYSAHFIDVTYHHKDMLGVRLELIYLLQYNENYEDAIPMTPTVQQRIIDAMKTWDNRIPWSAFTLSHRPQEPREDAVEIGQLGPADLRKLRLLYRLSQKWRYQYFVANVTFTKKKSITENNILTTEVCIGQLSNQDGVTLDPPTSISTDLLVQIMGVDDFLLRDRTRETTDKHYRLYQYCRIVVFMWPTKYHGRHVEPLSAGDAFLKEWLMKRQLNYSDGCKITFKTRTEKAEFSSIALSLCQRGSDMKPFCLGAALQIRDPVLYEAALPGTRTVDLIQKGVDHLGFEAMVPIISRTLDLGVPVDLDAWCDYLLSLYKTRDQEAAFPLLRKLINRMTKVQYLSHIDPSGPNPVITTLKFFYVNNLPSISEALIRGLPHSYHQFWIPFIPQLQSLTQVLKNLRVPNGEAKIWVDRALTQIANQHPLPTADAFSTNYPTLAVTPSRNLSYTPPTIRILAICSTHGRVDLVRVIFRRILRSIPTPESLLQSPQQTRDQNLRFLKALAISAYNTLVSTDATITVDPHGIFFAKVLTKYLLPNLGTRPARPGFPEIPCECDECTKINNFLVLSSGYGGDPQRTRTLTIPFTTSQKLHHITDHLPARSDLALSRVPATTTQFSSVSHPVSTSTSLIPRTPGPGGTAAATAHPAILLRILPTPEMERWSNEQTWISNFISYIRPKKVVRDAMGGLWEDAMDALQPAGEGWAQGVMELDCGEIVMLEELEEEEERRRDSWGLLVERGKRRWSARERMEVRREVRQDGGGVEEEEDDDDDEGDVPTGVTIRSPRDGKRRKRVRVV